MALPKIVDFDDPNFDPYIADDLFLGEFPDIYETVAKWRAEGPVLEGSYNETLGLLPNYSEVTFKPHFRVLTYDAVHHVFSNPVLFSNASMAITLGESFGHKSLSTLEAPEHLKYRKIFQRAFLPSVVSQWGEKFVQPVVDELLNAFRSTGNADLITQFARLYPFGVIFRMLGMPEEDRVVFQKLMLAQVLIPIEPVRARVATTRLGEYFSAVIDERIANPGDDLVSELAAAEVDGERLPKQVLIDFLRQLFNAGGDTTYRGTACLLHATLTTPGLLDEMRNDRAIIPKAVEEVLRWEGPVMATERVVTQDTEIEGVVIPKGSLISVMLGAANRDPAKYANPDKFDPNREQHTRHVAFAQGPHVCLGQHLARVEITRAMNTLLDQLPGLRVDPKYAMPVIMGSTLRAPRELHVVFDSA